MSNLSAKDKALKLVNQMKCVPNNIDGSDYLPLGIAKRCALTAVEYLITDEEMYTNGDVNPVRFWKEVQSEINKL